MFRQETDTCSPGWKEKKKLSMGRQGGGGLLRRRLQRLSVVEILFRDYLDTPNPFWAKGRPNTGFYRIDREALDPTKESPWLKEDGEDGTKMVTLLSPRVQALEEAKRIERKNKTASIKIKKTRAVFDRFQETWNGQHETLQLKDHNQLYLASICTW